MRLLFLLLFIYFSVALLLTIFQRSLLYLPSPESGLYSELLNSIENDAGGFDYWQVNPGRLGAIIYFGGNAESVEYNIESFGQLFQDKTVYLMAYRGYGGSKGRPSEAGIYSDAKKLYTQIAANHKTVSVIGRSLGSGVATRLASEHEVEKLVLVTPFDSILAVAQQRFRVFPLRWLLRDKYLSTAYAPAVKASALLLIAAQDQVIPPAHANKLAESFAPDLIDTITLPGTDHNNIAGHRDYDSHLQRFLQ